MSKHNIHLPRAVYQEVKSIPAQSKSGMFNSDSWTVRMYPETKTLNTMLCTSVEPRRYVAEWSPADWSGPGLYRVLQITDLKKKSGFQVCIGLRIMCSHVRQEPYCSLRHSSAQALGFCGMIKC